MQGSAKFFEWRHSLQQRRTSDESDEFSKKES